MGPWGGGIGRGVGRYRDWNGGGGRYRDAGGVIGRGVGGEVLGWEGGIVMGVGGEGGIGMGVGAGRRYRDGKSKVLINPKLSPRFRLAKGEEVDKEEGREEKSFNKSTTFAPLFLLQPRQFYKILGMLYVNNIT